MSGKPNFLVIMTDQMRSDWMGCAGHPVVRTPNIDALAARGVRFTDFHAASPICMPNRASFMTGRMPSVHGLRYNGCALPTDASTFVEVLHAAGYDTASIGKSHLQPFTENPARHAEDGLDRLIPEAWDRSEAPSVEAPENYRGAGSYDPPLPYYGFSHVEFASQHGDRCGGHYGQWLRANVPGWEALWDRANQLPHNYSCPQAFRTPVPEELYPTHWIADRAIEYLGDAARGDAPFFAFVSFPDPHHPFNPPGKYWDMYDPNDFSLELPFEAHQNPPPPLAWLDAQLKDGQAAPSPQSARRVEVRGLQEAMALTAGMITMIDDQIGRLMEALDATGQTENTVVIFTSDHGDYLGDFGMLLKGALPFRSISQVPMIWADPTRRPGECLALGTTIDIGPTLLARAGLAPYHGIQGNDLAPAMDGAEGRETLYTEYNDGFARMGFERPARVRTVRSKDWRLSLYAWEDWGELYDLCNDPEETRNLWDNTDYAEIRAELTLVLSHHLAQQMDESPRSLMLA